MAATVNGFTSAAVPISAAYAPEFIKVTDDSGKPIDNTDGSLHVTGTATGQWRGLSWTFPCPVQGTVKLSGTSIAGLSFNIKCLDAKGQQLGEQMNLGNSVMAIPAGTVSLFLNVISAEATPTAKDGDLRVQLESGDTAHEWMKPDVTSLEGGL